ncbi:erythrocyte membrane protein 1, PfEMP1, putative [Plasmodium sp. gorilla clade G2]|uniref:erythrocyte membrane protein 1, PfEMP1, putative n=1 Tax=Plasmodium sp. gorilla clade G2 TaxID=880535 RepID=UPI000D2F11C7|nr:erythrocyte membrane protein 1, PfEMP1, putative [Plasmodium sp. gorilla clade G2]SOV20247.1 erythrocyte membrane protein 1, PfEMP1, putative [Plasmodium sp. gorilla clade G2]
MTQLDNICIKKQCNSICNGATCPPCQKECAKYHKWLLTKKMSGMDKKINIKRNTKIVREKIVEYMKKTSKKPNEFIEHYAKVCEHADLNNVFKKKDDQYKPYRGKCKKCIEELTKDVLDKIQNKGGTNSTTNKNIFLFCDEKCDEGSENLYKKYIEQEDKYKNISDLSENVYIPPRKQKICFKGLDGSVNDVKDQDKLFEHLIKLAAIEGFNLGEYYKDKKNKEGKEEEAKKYNYDVLPCNALKYSFLDLRDTILGTDNLEPPDKGTEKNLSGIFEKVYDQKGAKPGSQERQTWWTQNQQCVWEAMKCGYKKSRDEGSPSGTKPKPSVDDLAKCTTIPSETEYPLGTDRPSNGQCKDCSTCKTACDHYKTFIEGWKKQYDDQKKKFDDDTTKKQYTTHPVASTSQNAREYLDKSLKTACQNSKPSGTNDCNCMSDVSLSATDDTPKSLEETPDIVKDKCPCSQQKPQAPAASECKIDQYIRDNKNINIGNGKNPCNSKDKVNWDCGGTRNSPVSGKGECMPPRRQKMCIKYLTELSQIQNITSPDELKEAVIKSASLETYFLWEQYKKDKEKENRKPNEELKKGTIPPDFLRMMFYTLGDFKDLITGKDIGNKIGDVQKARTKIDKILKPSVQPPQQDPSSWWKSVESEVWEAMVCSLSYNGSTVDTGIREALKNNDKNNYDKVNFSDPSGVDLPTFVARPQFLRWMTEWGEHYCVTQKKHYTDVQTQCSNCSVVNGAGGSVTCKNCDNCKQKCQAYKTEIQKWENQWNQQKEKYQKLYNQISGATTKSTQEDPVVTYLKPHTGDTTYATAGGYLKQEGFISECKEQKNFDKNSGGKDTDYAFRNYPHKFNDQCVCTPAAQKPKDQGSHNSQQPGKVPGVGPGQGRSGSSKTSPKPAQNCVHGLDAGKQGDGGLCQGGTVTKINPGGGQGGIQVTPASPSGPPADPGAAGQPQSSQVDTSQTSSSSSQGTSSSTSPSGKVVDNGQAGATSKADPDASLPASNTPNSDNWLDLIKNYVLAPAAIAGIGGYIGTLGAIETAPDIISKGLEYGVPTTVIGLGTGIGAGKAVATKLWDKLIKFIEPSSDGSSSSSSNTSPSNPQDPGSNGGQKNPQSPITPPSSGKTPNNLVTSTLPPVGISFVLGSIALLFYLK